MGEVRKINFGKYKGTPIVKLIVTHIGYIMWCLNNINSFQLTEEEQILYDALAISIIRDECPMTFPIEGLKDFIKDKESLAKLASPFINKSGGRTYLNIDKASKEIKEIYIKYKRLKEAELEGEIDYLKVFNEIDYFLKQVENLTYDNR